MQPTPPPGLEVVPLDTVKDYLRVVDDTEDTKIQAMIPRAQLWVEEHTGVALTQRDFTDFVLPRGGVVRLSRAPLISIGGCAYSDSGGETQSFAPIAAPPTTKLMGEWPPTNGQPFQITYKAGLAADQAGLAAIDARLIGAELALIEGEYTAGFAYPDEAKTAATNCLFYMKFVAP